VPNANLKVDKGNPTGHDVISLSSSDTVFCCSIRSGCKLATEENASPFGADRLVVGMAESDRKNLSRPVRRRLIVLGDGEGAGKNESTDRERMSVLSLCWSRLQGLRFDFGEPVRFKLRFEVVLIHLGTSVFSGCR
jgi:hypothetical protein